MEERRKTPLSEEQRQSLVDVILEAIRSEFATHAIPQELHKKHHEYLEVVLQDRQRRLERNEKIKVSVLGWFVITVLGGIGTLAYQLFVTLKEHWK
jgi:hypothetical protein